jgi:hypothetical protein
MRNTRLIEQEKDFDQVTGIVNDRLIIFFLKRLHLYRDEKNTKYLYFTLKCLEKFVLNLLKKLQLLEKMCSYETEGIKQVSIQIQSKLFYEEANLSLLVSLSRDTKSHSRKYMFFNGRYLECVASTVHLLFKLLETNWDNENGVVTRRIKCGAKGSIRSN